MISKDQLKDGAYYEGHDDQGYPAVAVWSAEKNMFFTNEFHWEETHVLPMSYDGEETEYWAQFAPIAEIEPRKDEIVSLDEIKEIAV